MVEYIHLQASWGFGIQHLSDEEAGKFVKAVYGFVLFGHQYYDDTNRKESVLISSALAALPFDMKRFGSGTEGISLDEELAKRVRSDSAKKAARARWSRKKGGTVCSEDSAECRTGSESSVSGENEPQEDECEAHMASVVASSECKQHADECVQCGHYEMHEAHEEHARASEECAQHADGCAQCGHQEAHETHEEPTRASEECKQHAEGCAQCGHQEA
ncbi:MAG: hypothetical protein IJT77_11320, partial [Clostridia bacterium]|nr:hypothetical protein [Clostridia bacterium]